MCFVDYITDECADVADKIIQYYKGPYFLLWVQRSNDFEQRVLAVIPVKWIDVI